VGHSLLPRVGLMVGILITSLAPATTQASAASCDFEQPGDAPKVPAVTAPPKTEEWEEQYAVAERTMARLDSSLEAVRAAAADASSSTEMLATAVTPAEQEILHRQNVVRAITLDVDSELKAQAPAQDGGALLDQGDRLSIDIFVVGDDCAFLREVQSGYPDITIRPVSAPNQAPLRVLESELAALDANTNYLQARGVLIGLATLNLYGNSLDIHLLPTSSPDAEQLLTETVGDIAVMISRDGEIQSAG
jgi:hypothetical protein